MDLDNLQSDVASFASSLGLASSLPSSGFNDSDFRPKKKPQNSPKTHKKEANPSSQTRKFEKPRSNNAQIQKPRPKKPNPNSNPNKKDEIFGANDKNYKNPRSNNAQIQNPRANKPNPNYINKKDEIFGDNDKNYKSFDKFRNLPKLPLVKASALGAWHIDEEELEGKVLGEGKGRVEVGDVEEWKKLVAKKKELGERLLAQYTVDYEASRGQSGDIKMLIATQRSGTATDKVSAYSVLVGDNPIANMRSLDALVAMVTSKVGKRHALTGFEALKELFTESLLPDRKLKTLFQRPLNHLPETKDGYSLLLFWYWEECLKLRYERFVSALEEASRDMLPILKDKALKIMYALLKSKSEQERKLLTALVNKLGDPNHKAASNAIYYLTNLLSDHPNMKVVVIDEVDSFLFRPHLGMRAKYYAVNFLSQIRLSDKGDGPKVAKRLLSVYFALFKVLVSSVVGGQKANTNKEINSKSTVRDKKVQDSSESHMELDSRLLSVLLTGVNRAFPFVPADEADDIVDVEAPMLFQLVHSENFNVGIQALMLIDKISSNNQVVSDRYYRALYAKMLLPAALNTSKAEMFIGLLLRAMKNDVNLKRVAAFSKRLLQVALQQQPQYACGCLFLLSEVLKARPPLWSMAIQNETVDDELEHFEDVPDETETPPDFDAEIQQSKDDDKSNNSESNTGSDSLEDEEASAASSSEDDASDEDDGIFMRGSVEKSQEPYSTKMSDNRNQPNESSGKQSLPGGYDPRHREPSFCQAEHTSWWELTALASHTHPSVSTMARTILSGANIVYNGNPLNDLSLAAFLDKFMEKKAKQTAWHGGSQIEPAKKVGG